MGPRKLTDRTLAFAASPGLASRIVTDSGRTMARPGPSLIDPSMTGTDTPRTSARPWTTVAGTLLLRPTNSATNGVAGFA